MAIPYYYSHSYSQTGLYRARNGILFGEEAFLTKQVHDAGGKLYYDPKLVVRHKESATVSRLPSRRTYEFARTAYPDYRKFWK